MHEAYAKMKLYFDGENTADAKFSFGYPIVVRNKGTSNSPDEVNYTFSATLVNAGVDAPSPKDSDLALQEWPESVIFVRPFLGPSTNVGFLKETVAFADTLDVVGLKRKLEPSHWVVHAPSNEGPTHTEVWFPVDE